MTIEFHNHPYKISTDQALLDIEAIHTFLKQTYWSPGIPKETLQRAIKNSLCFGLYEDIKQIGFARAISDFSTFAYLADVFIIEEYRGKKLAKWLMQSIMAHPDLQGLRCWLLRTRDAHGLYKPFGFTSPKRIESYMEITVPDIYLKISANEKLTV